MNMRWQDEVIIMESVKFGGELPSRSFEECKTAVPKNQEKTRAARPKKADEKKT
jgi:hypothetical protein